MNSLSTLYKPRHTHTHNYIILHCDGAVARGCCFPLTVANDSDAFVIVKISARSEKEKNVRKHRKYTDYNRTTGVLVMTDNLGRCAKLEIKIKF